MTLFQSELSSEEVAIFVTKAEVISNQTLLTEILSNVEVENVTYFLQTLTVLAAQVL